jgi:hypothetical protein
MRNAKMIVCLGTLAAWIGVPNLSVAEDNCSGYWVRVGTTEVPLHNDPSSPQHMGVGTCYVGGHCTYTDKDGDERTVRSEGLGQGTWRIVGGTGKYRNATSSGWWKVSRTESGRQGGEVSMGTWGATCKLD